MLGSASATASPHSKEKTLPTTEDVGADVRGAPTLILQEIVFTHQVLPKAEICDGYPVGPRKDKGMVPSNPGPLTDSKVRRGCHSFAKTSRLIDGYLG